MYSAFRNSSTKVFARCGQSYARAASTIGTLSILPADFVKAFTVHVRPVSSNIMQSFPSTTILACESSSVRWIPSQCSSVSNVAEAIRDAIRGISTFCGSLLPSTLETLRSISHAYFLAVMPKIVLAMERFFSSSDDLFEPFVDSLRAAAISET